MMNCETCGEIIPDNAVMCPRCGAATQAARRSQPPSYTPQQGYMPPPQQGYMPPPQQGYMPPQQQGYMPPQQGYMPPPYPGHMPPPQQRYMPPPQQNYGYAQQQYAPYPPPINVTVVNTKNNTPVIVEVILSLFGIFGVGWLMAGETSIGVVLLICSFVVYWPLAIAFAVFTLGLCDVPLVIAAIVFNAIILNKTLNRKASPYPMP